MVGRFDRVVVQASFHGHWGRSDTWGRLSSLPGSLERLLHVRLLPQCLHGLHGDLLGAGAGEHDHRAVGPASLDGQNRLIRCLFYHTLVDSSKGCDKEHAQRIIGFAAQAAAKQRIDRIPLSCYTWPWVREKLVRRAGSEGQSAHDRLLVLRSSLHAGV